MHQQPQHKEELHPLAPTVYRIPNAKAWTERTRRVAAQTTEPPPVAFVFILGLPGVGKFTTATSLLSEFIYDPEGEFHKRATPLPENLVVGYEDYALELFTGRLDGDILSPQGIMSPPPDQEIATRRMIQHTQQWIETHERRPKILLTDAVAVSYPMRNQGASAVIWATEFAKEHTNAAVFAAFLLGPTVQHHSQKERRQLSTLTEPHEITNVFTSLRRALDQPLETELDVLFLKYSYAGQEGIRQTTQITDALVYDYISSVRNVSIDEFSQPKIRQQAYEAYYAYMSHEVFGLNSSNVLIGTNTMLRRSDAQIPLNVSLARKHLIIPNVANPKINS